MKSKLENLFDHFKHLGVKVKNSKFAHPTDSQIIHAPLKEKEKKRVENKERRKKINLYRQNNSRFDVLYLAITG